MFERDSPQRGKRKTRYIMKFGGSSLSGAENVNKCASLIREYKKSGSTSLVVVCSAVGRTTDDLLEAVDLAKVSGFAEAKQVLNKVKKTHVRIISGAIRYPSLSKKAVSFTETHIAQLERTVYGVSLLKDISSRSLDFVLSFGEKLSTKIMSCVLESIGLKSRYLTGGEAGIVTDDRFGSAKPILKITEQNLRKKLIPLLEEGITPVVAGFIAETFEDKQITTLGRGGSDYSASLIAAAIDADQVFLWTDVDGILTADPRIVKDANIVRRITYLEAMEMSAFGAKSMQPRALEPVALKEIPVRIKNTFNPNSEGTLIVSPHRIQNNVNFDIKSISSLSDVAIVALSGTSIVGQPGTALKIFEILEDLEVSLLMISQSVSEGNVSIVIKKQDLVKVIRTLKQTLLGDSEEGSSSILGSSAWTKKKDSVFAKIEYENDVAIVAVLGRGMIGNPGVAGRIFTTVAKEGINIKMIAQGSSEISISFVIKEKDRSKAVIALHEEFGLGRAIRNDRDQDIQETPTKLIAS
jgi:aspartate kinase